MELEELNFPFDPHNMMGRKKIQEKMVEMGQAQGKIMLVQALRGEYCLVTNG